MTPAPADRHRAGLEAARRVLDAVAPDHSDAELRWLRARYR